MLLALCQNCMCVPWLLFEGKHLVSCFGNFRISVRFFLLLSKLSVPFEVRFPLKHCAANLLCHVWHLFKHIAGCCWRLYTTATAIWIFFSWNHQPSQIFLFLFSFNLVHICCRHIWVFRKYPFNKLMSVSMRLSCYLLIMNLITMSK